MTKENFLDKWIEALPLNSKDSDRKEMAYDIDLMLDYAKLYAESRVKKCDLADVGGNEVALPRGDEWKDFAISPSIVNDPKRSVDYQAGFKDCLIEIKKRLRAARQ